MYGFFMPTFRPEIRAINPYVPGRPIEDVAREIGMSPGEIVKLASNEYPEGPFPGVLERAVATLETANRYPDNDVHDLGLALSEHLDIAVENLWFGAGSTALLGSIAIASGGPGTSAVYAWPSFVMYRIITQWSGADRLEVPLDEGYTHHLEAMEAAIRGNTTVVYVCNPNNPTGTIVPASDLTEFIARLPESVMVVVDEAYHHFVTDDSYATAIPLALERPNVVVLRTFSKVYSLASLRVGFAVAAPETIVELRKAQPPFSVSQLAQTAALASLGDDSELNRRVKANAAARHQLLGAIAERGLRHAPSQTNFVFFRLGEDAAATASAFTQRGVIVRGLSRGWIRLTVGAESENERFTRALDEIVSE